MKQDRVYLDPNNLEESLIQLSLIYDLDGATLDIMERLLALHLRPVILVLNDDSNPDVYEDVPLADRFTFDIRTDELLVFSRDLLTFIDAMVEMAMYSLGFATLLGAEEAWMVEFAIGAWKPVRSRVKRQLGIPVEDQPRWIVGLPPHAEDAPPDDPYPFLTIVSQLDLGSFTEMVRLAARDDVEVNFPQGADPRVIEVYIRVKTAMFQVAEGLGLDGWREFNHRLLSTVQQLDEEYQPRRLPRPPWWERLEGGRRGQRGTLASNEDLPAPPDDPADSPELGDDPPDEPAEERWNPFAEFIEHLFEDEEEDRD